jgi:hypothetical protein
MSHISTAVEYGLHCLLYLSDPAAGVHEASSKDLAELQGVPAEYLAKLFTKLRRRAWWFQARAARRTNQRAGRRQCNRWQQGAVRLPRDPWQLRRVWRQATGVGHPRRLLDSRSHAGRRKAYDRSTRDAFSRRPRNADHRKSAVRVRSASREVAGTSFIETPR